MPYEGLLKQGRIRESRFRRSEIEALLRGAVDQASTALLDEVPVEIRHNIAYDAVRSAAQAVMHAEGYRTVNQAGHHEAVFLFLAQVDGGKWQSEAGYFNSAREKRNLSEYGSYGRIVASEAVELAEAAQTFLAAVTDWLRERGFDFREE